MGVPEEHQALLPRHPESMGGSPNGPSHPRWQRLKDSMSSPNLRPKLKTILGVLVIFSIIFAIFGGIHISSSSSHKVRLMPTPIAVRLIHASVLCDLSPPLAT